MPPMLSMQNVYMRLISMAVMPILGLLPAWAVGLVTYSAAGILHVDYGGFGMAGATGLVGAFAIFAKWGIKPQDIYGNPLIWGSVIRVATYGLNSLVAMLPLSLASAIYIDAMNTGVNFDMPSLCAALAGGLGLNLGIFAMFGVKTPAPR